MSLDQSIRKTASIARCVSVAVTATDPTIFNPLTDARRDMVLGACCIPRVRHSVERGDELPEMETLSR